MRVRQFSQWRFLPFDLPPCVDWPPSFDMFSGVLGRFRLRYVDLGGIAKPVAYMMLMSFMRALVGRLKFPYIL